MRSTSIGSISEVALRVIVCSLSGAAVAWALYVFPTFWIQAGVEQTAKHIIAGDSFKPTVLNSVNAILPQIKDEKFNRPSALSSAALIGLRLLEKSIADGDQSAIDTRMIELQSVIHRSLSNTPADPFLWLVLFWLENSQNGFARDHLKYLRTSYLIGPCEGWVAIKRNRLALAIFSQLPTDLAENAIHEFAQLVDSLFIDEAADILGGPGWPVRNRLLLGMKDIPLVNRQFFAKTVYRRGYDVSVPGVAPRAFRPWN